MPVMDGIEMTKKITSESNNYVKVIVLTSNVNKKLTNRAIENGAAAVLKKPLDVDELKRIL